VGRAALHRIRRLDAAAPAEVELVARRMRETLVEVLGEERGRAMYSLDWLRERVRWHLDPEQCQGQVFVAEGAEGGIAGHVVVRVEHENAGDGGEFGLFSTLFVVPERRRTGLATRLLRRGEAWLLERGMAQAATDTAADNAPLIALFEKQGYRIVLRADAMVRLAKDLPAQT